MGLSKGELDRQINNYHRDLYVMETIDSLQALVINPVSYVKKPSDVFQLYPGSLRYPIGMIVNVS